MRNNGDLGGVGETELLECLLTLSPNWRSGGVNLFSIFKNFNFILNFEFTLSKIVVQTNFPRIGKTYIFRPGTKSTFTWTMPYKSIPVLVIT